MNNPQLNDALDAYVRAAINHYLVTNGVPHTRDHLATDVHAARKKVEELYHPNGPGTPGGRFQNLMSELDTRFPDSHPFSSSPPELRYLAAIDALKVDHARLADIVERWDIREDS